MTEESMIERVAKAMRDERGPDWPYTGHVELLGTARSAIGAMREPTDGVLSAAVEDNGSPRDPYDSWRAMIAAALA